jgi:DNA polymerase-3 subunit beta
MKVSLIHENLAKALLYINKAVSSRPNIPILANVLLETEKGKLKLSATNLDIGISTWIGATVAEEGKVTVSARMLSDFVNSLKTGKIELLQHNQTLVVKSVDNTAEFYIIPAEDFPRVPEVEGEALLEMNATLLAESITKTAFAASTDESRPVLTGLLFKGTKKKLRIVGVDGFRLSKKEIDLEGDLESREFEEVVPARAVSEVESLIKDICGKEDIVKIYLLGNKNQMLFKVGDVELSTRLIEGKFPEYEQILPKDHKIEFKAEKSAFADMLKVVSIFARNVVGNKTKFAILGSENKLQLSTTVIDIGNNQSEIKVKELEGEDIETAYNVKFLQDMINTMGGEIFIFQTNGPTAPGVFIDPKDKNFVHVVMPMRIE